MLIVGVAVGAALCVVFAVWGFALMSADGRVSQSDFGMDVPKAKTEVFLLNMIAQQVGRPLTRVAMETLAPWRIKIRKRIDGAGRPGGMTFESYAQQTAGF